MEFIIMLGVLFVIFVAAVLLTKRIETPLKIPIQSDPTLPDHLVIVGPDAFKRYAWKNLKTGASGVYKIEYNELIRLLKEKS